MITTGVLSVTTGVIPGGFRRETEEGCPGPIPEQWINSALKVHA
jgi:hypothetical protein